MGSSAKSAKGKGNKHGVGSDHRKPNLKKKSKLVVTFDAEKRKEYLTGFHKRKQERRRFGLDMEAYKQKKRLLEAKKQRREEQKEKLASLNIVDINNNQKEDVENEKTASSDEEQGDGTVTKIMRFDDEHTQGKFGDVVTVTTSIGDLKSESEDDLSDDDLDISDEDDVGEDDASTTAKPFSGNGSRNNKEKQLTLFQRIQLKRKGKALPSKRSKLKDARTSRKAMMGASKKKGKHAPMSSSKRGREDDGGAASSGSGKANKKLPKMKHAGKKKHKRH